MDTRIGTIRLSTRVKMQALTVEADPAHSSIFVCTSECPLPCVLVSTKHSAGAELMAPAQREMTPSGFSFVSVRRIDRQTKHIIDNGDVHI
jgi:hypothetical protein